MALVVGSGRPGPAVAVAGEVRGQARPGRGQQEGWGRIHGRSCFRLCAVRRQSPYLNPGRGGAQRSAPGAALTVRVRREPGYAFVTVTGEIDIVTVARLREELDGLAAAGLAVVADLDRVSFIGAAGLGALAGAAGLAAAHGGSLRVVCARPLTRRLVVLTGLDRPVPLARTLAEALKAVAAGPDTPASGGTGTVRGGYPPAAPYRRPVLGACGEPEAV